MYNFFGLVITAIIISEILKISKIIDLFKENFWLYKKLLNVLLRVKKNKKHNNENFFKVLSCKMFIISFKIILTILIIIGIVLFLNIFYSKLLLELFSFLGIIKISILIFFYKKLRAF